MERLGLEEEYEHWRDAYCRERVLRSSSRWFVKVFLHILQVTMLTFAQPLEIVAFRNHVRFIPGAASIHPLISHHNSQPWTRKWR
jgi:hypothetical protein